MRIHIVMTIGEFPSFPFWAGESESHLSPRSRGGSSLCGFFVSSRFFFLSLRVKFLLKNDSEYPKDTGVTLFARFFLSSRCFFQSSSLSSLFFPILFFFSFLSHFAFFLLFLSFFLLATFERSQELVLNVSSL